MLLPLIFISLFSSVRSFFSFFLLYLSSSANFIIVDKNESFPFLLFCSDIFFFRAGGCHSAQGEENSSNEFFTFPFFLCSRTTPSASQFSGSTADGEKGEEVRTSRRKNLFDASAPSLRNI